MPPPAMLQSAVAGPRTVPPTAAWTATKETGAVALRLPARLPLRHGGPCIPPAYCRGLEDSGARPFTLELAAARLPRALFEVTLPAVLLSVALLGFRICPPSDPPVARFPHRPRRGVRGARERPYLVEPGRSGSARARPCRGIGSTVLPPGSFTAVGERYVAPGTVTGDRLARVLVIDPARKAPRFTLYGSGTVSTKGDVASLQLAGAKPLSLREEMKPAAASLFAADVLTDYFLRDFRTMTADFEKLLGASVARFLFACFALLFLVSASLVLLRITRWPLLNVLLLILAVRVYLLLYHWLAIDLAPTVARVVSDPLLARLAPSAAFVVLGVLLLLVDILFVPPEPVGDGGGSMNRSVLARIGPALFAFYLLAYAAFFAWGWFTFPDDSFLLMYQAEHAARRALLLLLDWAVPLTAAAVVTALSLAAGSSKRGGPALPFNQIVASSVLTFLVLAAGFTAVSETAGAEATGGWMIGRGRHGSRGITKSSRAPPAARLSGAGLRTTTGRAPVDRSRQPADRGGEDHRRGARVEGAGLSGQPRPTPPRSRRRRRCRIARCGRPGPTSTRKTGSPPSGTRGRPSRSIPSAPTRRASPRRRSRRSKAARRCSRRRTTAPSLRRRRRHSTC